MSEPISSDRPRPVPDIRKEEPAFVHNIRQLLGCLPVVGSVAVGLSGLAAFYIGIMHANNNANGALWMIAGSLGLIASSMGFGVLAWLVWANRDS